MSGYVDGGERPVQYDRRTKDVLKPAATYESVTVGDVDFEEAYETCYSWYASDYSGH